MGGARVMGAAAATRALPHAEGHLYHMNWEESEEDFGAHSQSSALNREGSRGNEILLIGEVHEGLRDKHDRQG